jgi:hypothetical protein
MLGICLSVGRKHGRSTMSRFLVPAVIAAAGLAATIVWEVQSDGRTATMVQAGNSASSVLTLPVQARAPDDPIETWVTTSLERPLLRESRRPDKVAETQRKGDDSLRLAGVVTGTFGDRAIFLMPGNTKPVVATVGTQVSDFVVRSIEPGRVLVDAAGVVRTYRPMLAGHGVSTLATSKRPQ